MPLLLKQKKQKPSNPHEENLASAFFIINFVFLPALATFICVPQYCAIQWCLFSHFEQTVHKR